MQNDFCHPDGYYERLGPPTRALTEVVQPVLRLLQVARRAGLPIFFTRLVYELEGGMEVGTSIRPAAFNNAGVRLVRGTWGANVIDVLEPRANEMLIDKSSYSAFYGTQFEATLHRREVDGVILCGVTTYGCVLHTAFDAFARGFAVVAVSDTTAGWFDDLSAGALGITDLLLGRTASADRTAALIERRSR